MLTIIIARLRNTKPIMQRVAEITMIGFVKANSFRRV